MLNDNDITIANLLAYLDGRGLVIEDADKLRQAITTYYELSPDTVIAHLYPEES
jgi:hypothetical protein